jgi:polyisoprenoid-binding protein YceI
MKGKWVVVPLLALALIAGCGGGKQQNGAAAPVAGAQAPAPAGGGGPVASGTPANGKYVVAKDQSSAQYQVHEIFLTEKLNGTAIGKTNAIDGELVFKNGAIQPSKVTVDLTKLKSDKARRDDTIKTRGLQTSKYPTAEFTITGVEGNVDAVAEGKEVPLKLKGNLKLHGVEKPVVWDGKASMTGGVVQLSATVQFVFKDFGMEPPSILNMISVDEKIQLDVLLVARNA